MKKFLNIDLHISVIADIIDVFKRVDETIQIEDWCLSGHSWVLNKQRKQLDVLTPNTWRNLDIKMLHAFHEKYDHILKTFDGFICCYPISFILFFEKYNKPIYIVNAVRYDMPFCWNNNYEMLKELHNCFTRLQEKKLLNFISNNKADDDYFKLGNPTIPTQIIPSLCLYTNMQWNPVRTNNMFLLYTGVLPNMHMSAHNIIHRSVLGRYKWDALMSFKGLIHLPYEASTMSIFEQISSEIPLFFPSKTFLKMLWENKQIPHQMNYWKHNNHGIIPAYLTSTEKCDFWLDRADYYDIEGYYYFDSFEHLYKLLDNFTDHLYEVRRKFIRNRKIKALEDYKKILC
jgi:hypothetical protein